MLKLFDRYWIALVMILTIAALPMRTQASAPAIVFSEVARAGSSVSSSDEWIELTNISDETLDLTGWSITGGGSSESTLVFPEESFVAPHSTLLITNYAYAHENTALGVEPNFVTATLSLPNGGFNLALYDDENTLVDVAGTDGAPLAGRSGGSANTDDGRYRSMVRVDRLTDGSLQESWTDADSSQGFLDGVEDLGTPGTVAFATVEAETLEETVDEESVEEPVVEETLEEVMEEGPEDSLTTSMLISEFVVDPNEEEAEWIELVNLSDVLVDLTGWTIEDAVGKQTVLEGTVAPSEYVVITAPLGKLNNDTDSITLKDSTGTAVDVVEYGTEELATPKDGSALARNESGLFELTYELTPGSMNVINPEKPEVIEEVEVVTEEVAEVVEEIVEDVVEEVVDEVQTETTFTTEPTIANIVISEFVVDPIGEGVEWIELYNAGNTQVTLEGWSIEDESGKATDPSTVTIEADGYALIESPKGRLNNDGDSVILKDASGAIIESVTYGKDAYPIPKNGEALARHGETFEVTELPTPGSANLIFVALEEIEEIVDTAEEPESTVLPPAHQSLGNGGSEAEGSQVEKIVEEVAIAKTLRFITLYPNTIGSDETEEYIELQNTGVETIDLQGWIIEDGSTDRYTFKESTLLTAGATVRLMRPETKIILNNTGDTLELIAPDEEVVDKVTYGNSAKGATYAFVNNVWKWSGTATTAESTAVTSSTSATKTSNSTHATNASSTVSSRVAQSVTVAQAKEKADGQKVVINGTVTVAPGMFGNQIFYLEDETGGIQVYLYSSNFPELLIGDVVQVTGELSTSRGERRVKLTGATGVALQSGTSSQHVETISLGNIDASFVGNLLSTTGQIQSKNATKLTLESSGATLTIYLKNNPAIDPNLFERGDTLTITGVLTSYDGELRLRPRSVDDMVVEEDTIVSTATISDTPTNDAGSSGIMLLLSTIAVLGLLALWRYVPRRRLTPVAV